MSEKREEWRKAKHETLAAAIAGWLDDVAEENDGYLDAETDDLALTPASPSVTGARRHSGSDRYRAWSDYYDLRKLPSGLWEATCKKCGDTCVRHPSVTSTGRVWRSSAQRVMDEVETHIMRGCRPMNEKRAGIELPDEPPF